MGQILCARCSASFLPLDPLEKLFPLFCRFSVLFNRSALHFAKIERCTRYFLPLHFNSKPTETLHIHLGGFFLGFTSRVFHSKAEIKLSIKITPQK